MVIKSKRKNKTDLSNLKHETVFEDENEKTKNDVKQINLITIK